MKKFFMIKEFAKLRNIHINSLLYYEKLGLLKPAYVNPETNYRYYEAEQLPILDTIILCIKLGIPLKDMKAYIDKDGNLNYQELLDYGQDLAKKRMEEIQTNLLMIERSLDIVKENEISVEKNGIYSRQIAQRQVIISDFFDIPGEIYVVEVETRRLYEKAQEHGFVPLLPAGIILHCLNETTIRYCVFLEVITKESGNPNVLILPKGEYECVKMELHASSKLVSEIKKYWDWENGMTVVVQNMYSAKYNFGSKPSEFQKIWIEL